MRRVVAIVLVSCAAAAATLALGSALASGPAATGAQAVHPAHLSAAASPLAGLNRSFRRIAPSARCDAAAGKARTARGLRAAALKNAAKASPKVLRAKKKKLRRAIRLLRSAAELCEATAPPGGSPGNGAPPAPNPYPPPGPAPSPPPPGTQTRAFTASGVLAFNPSTAQTASASAPILLQLTNNSGSVGHNIGLRTAPPPPQTVRAGPSTTVFGPNEVTSVVIPAGTLAPGTYQIFCARPGHATPTTGMIVPLTVVTP